MEEILRYLHTMIRVSNLEESLGFFQILGLKEIRRRDSDKGRFTNVHLAAEDDIEMAKKISEPLHLNLHIIGIMRSITGVVISGTLPSR